MLRLLLPFLLVLSSSSLGLYAQNFDGGFNFVLPHDDTSRQTFLPFFPPTPINDFIDIDADGHFSHLGQPIRFWGINLTAGGCFPLKEKAGFIAGRMRKMGINLVRFHHMDNPWTTDNGTLFVRSSGTTRSLNPITLDRMHYLLAQMKQEGIFANINLHVGRTFLEGDGVADADSLPEFGKAVTYFDPYLIELQKEFARQLLTSRNPYTQLSLSEDPVMAMVEITNENSLYRFWKSGELKPISQGGALSSRHNQILDQRWQEFLRQKYGDQQSLETAWAEGAIDPGNNGNALRNGSFETGSFGNDWLLELHEDANATALVDGVNPYDGNHSARVNVSAASSAGWHCQLLQSGLSIEKDKNYVIRFAARSNRNRTASIGLMRHNAPYTYYGGTTISLNNNWQEYSFTVKAPEDNELEARLSVSLADQVGAVWLDQLRMEEASIVGLEDGEELSAGNIRRIHWSDRLFHTPQRIADQAEFYFSIQKGYFDDMYQFLRDRLGVQVPITGTNAITGHGEAMSMQNMDFVDDHAYWNHPLFPSIPWSSYDWLIDNEPMVKSEFLGTIPGLFAGLAARGKPYTISEYNHPFPNHFQTELFAILTAYASLHDADALMLYSYNESHQNWEADWINGFFNIHRNNAMMGLFPIYSYAFRQKLLTADPDPILIDYPEDYVYQLSVDDNTGPWTAFHPYESGIGLQRAIRTQGYAAEEVPDFSDLPSTPGRVFETAGEETRVNTNEGIVASTGEQFIGICGFLDQANGQQFGPLQLQSANSFGTLSWLSLDEQPLPQSQRSVIALSSRIQNEGMVWDGDQTVHDQWGTSPTSIFPLQIALRLQIDAPAIQVHPLDATGAASTYRTYLPNDEGIFDILLDQREDKTLWFGIETTQLTNVQSVSATTFDMRIHPNPTGALLHLSAQLPKGHRQAEWIISNSMGQTVRRRNVDKRLTHLQRQSLSVDDLPAGMYLVRLRVDGQEASLPLVIQR